MQATLALPMLLPFARVVELHGSTVAAAMHAQAAELLTHVGISQDRPLIEVRVPHGVAAKLLDIAIKLTGNLALALHAGSRIEVGDFGIYEYLLRSCSTLGDALQVGAEHIALLHDAAEIDVIVDEEQILWRHHLELEPERDERPGIHEYVMASFITAVRRIVAADVAPLAVHFIHRQPPYLAEYDRLFRAPCYFGADYNAFVMPRSAALRALPTSDPALFRLMQHQASVLLAQLPRRRPFRSRVCDAIAAELAVSGASLRSVARRLGLSQSQLRRRLREHGATHTGLVDLVRRQRARELLARTAAPLEDIALATGFSHATALHRAFRRWYGVTPEQYRKDL